MLGGVQGCWGRCSLPGWLAGFARAGRGAAQQLRLHCCSLNTTHEAHTPAFPCSAPLRLATRARR